jgi:hypothetical protein
MRVLWHLRGDRPKPRLPLWRVRLMHDATDVLLAIEHVIIIVRPFASRPAFKQTQ